MSEEALAYLIIGYFAGCGVTLMSMDMPRHETYLFRRLAVWPLYWAYLVVKMGFMLAHEVRR